MHDAEDKVRLGDKLRREGIWEIFDQKLYEAEGFKTFDEYRDAKPDIAAAMSEIKWPAKLRKTIAESLSEAGMSNKRIAQALGVTAVTVGEDLRPPGRRRTSANQKKSSGQMEAPGQMRTPNEVFHVGNDEGIQRTRFLFERLQKYSVEWHSHVDALTTAQAETLVESGGITQELVDAIVDNIREAYTKLRTRQHTDSNPNKTRLRILPESED